MRPLTFRILRELTHRRFTSGTLLAEKLGVSRSSISDALKDAEVAGIRIFSVTRRGYQLAEPLDLLDAAAMQVALDASLATASRPIKLEVVDIVDSTNTALLARARAGETQAVCLAAEMQTAGRGRRGRSWQSSLGGSLTFSLLWRFDCGVAGLAGLSLAIGLGLVQALRAAGITEAQVKWPNDIWVNEKKLAGILIETQGDALGPVTAIIGIGLNYSLPEAMRAAIAQPVCDFMTHGDQDISRNALLARVLEHLSGVLPRFEATGFASMRRVWRDFHALQGRAVQVVQGDGRPFAATVKDVSAEGALIVMAQGRELALNSADISLRV